MFRVLKTLWVAMFSIAVKINKTVVKRKRSSRKYETSLADGSWFIAPNAMRINIANVAIIGML